MAPRTVLQSGFRYSHFARSLWLAGYMVMVSIGSIEAQTPASIQIIHAAPNPLWDTVDVYAGAKLIADNLPFSNATAYIDLPLPLPNRIRITSASGASAFSALDLSLVSGRQYCMVIGEHNVLADPEISLIIEEDARQQAADKERTEVCFIHASSKLPALDLFTITAGTFASNFEFGIITPYISLPPEALYYDVRLAGMAAIFSTHLLYLGGRKGEAVHIVATGDANMPQNIRMFAVFSDGFMVPVDAAPAAHVQYINLINDTVDVYSNDARLAKNIRRAGATPYQSIPSGLNFEVGVASSKAVGAAAAAYLKTPYRFEDGKTYTLISAGLRGSAVHPPRFFISDFSLEIPEDTNKVGLIFFNGAYNTLAVEVSPQQGNAWFKDVVYGAYNAWQNVAPKPWRIKVAAVGSNLPAQEFDLNLSHDRRTTVVLLATHHPVTEALEVWAIRGDGTSEKLSLSTGLIQQPMVQVGKIYPNPFQNIIFVEMELKETTNISVRVLNAIGQEVLAQPAITCLPGSASIEIETTQLQAGVYFLKIITGKKDYTFIVSKGR